MTSIGSREAKTHLPQLLERVAKGKKFVITRHGQPVAMLVSPPGDEKPDVAKVIQEFKAYSQRQGRTLGDLTIREMIEEGQRT